MQIIKKFTEIRNIINEREDKLLSQIDSKFDDLFFKKNEVLLRKSSKFPNMIEASLIKGKKLNEEWNNNIEKLNSKINDCIELENSIQTISELNENIIKFYSPMKEINLVKIEESGFNRLIEKINDLSEILIENIGTEFTFNFRNGVNYIVTNDGSVATKNNGGNQFNCTVMGDKEIPDNKISKWKVKLNTFENNSFDILIGIGPDNPNNKINFYKECFTFSCVNSKVVLKSESYSKYIEHSNRLKKGDIITVIVDRIKGNLSFAVNDINYGIANCKIEKKDILYPIIILYEENQQVELIKNII